MLGLCCGALAQHGKGGAAKTNSTGRYEGTAKNKAEDVITVTLDLTEKDGALSGSDPFVAWRFHHYWRLPKG